MTWTVPKLEDCDVSIEPFEFTVLLAMAEFARKTPGGIVIPESTADREEWGADQARILAISPLAFSYAEFPPGHRLPQVGDVVFVGKYPGDAVNGKDGRKYRLAHGREIKAVIEKATPDSKLLVEYARFTEGATAAAKALLGAAADEIYTQVNAMFAEVGEPTNIAWTPGGNSHVVFANGAVKPEGMPVHDFRDDFVEATLSAVREHFPNSANQRVHWRRLPEVEAFVESDWETGSFAWSKDPRVKVSLRIGADDIANEAMNDAA